MGHPVFIVGHMMQGTKEISPWLTAQRFSHISCTFLTFCSLLGISYLCAITFDRCYSLYSPLRYKINMTKAKVIVILVIIWTCCSIFSLGSFVYYYPIYTYEVSQQGYLKLPLWSNDAETRQAERASNNLTFSKCLHLVDLNNLRILMTHDKMAVKASIPG